MTIQTKNHVTVMQRHVTPDGLSLKCYTTDAETGRTAAIGWLWLGIKALDEMRAQVDHERNLVAQPMLPPWDPQPDDSNVRWLPPQP